MSTRRECSSRVLKRVAEMVVLPEAGVKRGIWGFEERAGGRKGRRQRRKRMAVLFEEIYMLV